MAQKHPKMTKMTKNTKNTKKGQKTPKMSKNGQKHQKSLKIAKCQKWGSPKWPPRGPEKKAPLSNRRIGTRNTDSHMVSIQKGQKSTPDFRACARPPKKGRIKAKLKFFFELFQKTSKNRHFWPKFDIFRLFWPFSPKSSKNTLFRPFFRYPQLNASYAQKHHFSLNFTLLLLVY